MQRGAKILSKGIFASILRDVSLPRAMHLITSIHLLITAMHLFAIRMGALKDPLAIRRAKRIIPKKLPQRILRNVKISGSSCLGDLAKDSYCWIVPSTRRCCCRNTCRKLDGRGATVACPRYFYSPANPRTGWIWQIVSRKIGNDRMKRNAR